MKIFSSVYGGYLLIIGLLVLLSMFLLYMHTVKSPTLEHIHPFHANRNNEILRAGASSSNADNSPKSSRVSSSSSSIIPSLSSASASSPLHPSPPSPFSSSQYLARQKDGVGLKKLSPTGFTIDDASVNGKAGFPIRIFLDFHYTSNQFTFVNYKALESVLSLYYNKDDSDKSFKTVEVILLGPHTANYYKVGNFLSKHYFEKYLKYGFEVRVIVIYQSDVFFRWHEKNTLPSDLAARPSWLAARRLRGDKIAAKDSDFRFNDSASIADQVGLGLNFFEREMKICCSLRIIQDLTNPRFHPIYLLAYARIMNLYLYGGIYVDFEWMQQARLDEYPSFKSIREGAIVISYCSNTSPIGYFDDEQIIEGKNDRDIYNRYCHASTALVFRNPKSPVLLCVLEMYERESSTLQHCIASARSDYNDHVVIGNACLMSAFDQCFYQEDAVNEFDSVSSKPDTQSTCYNFRRESDRAFLHSQLLKSDRYKSNTLDNKRRNEYFVENRDKDWSLNYYCSYPSSIVPWFSSFTSAGNSINAVAGGSIRSSNDKNGVTDFIYDSNLEILALFNNIKTDVSHFWGYSTQPSFPSVAISTESESEYITEWLGPNAYSDSWDVPKAESPLHRSIEANNLIVRDGRHWNYKCNHYYNPFASKQADMSCSPYFVIPGFMKAGSTFLYDLILTNANNRDKLTGDTINVKGEIRALHNLRGGSFKETGCYDLPASYLLNDGENNFSQISLSFISPKKSKETRGYVESQNLNNFQRRMNCFPFVEEGEPFIFGDATVYNINRLGSQQFISLDARNTRKDTEISRSSSSSISSSSNSDSDVKVFVPVVISVRHPVRRFLSHYKFTSNNVDLKINNLVHDVLVDRNGGLWTMHYIAKHALYLLDLMQVAKENHLQDKEDRELMANEFANTMDLLRLSYFKNGDLPSDNLQNKYFIGDNGNANVDNLQRYRYRHVNRMPGSSEKTIVYTRDKWTMYAFTLLVGSVYIAPIYQFSSILDFYGKTSSSKLNENIYIVCVEKLNLKTQLPSQDQNSQLNSVLTEMNSLFSFMKIAFNTEVKPVSFFETYLKTKLNLTLDEFTSSSLAELYDPFNKLLDYYMGDRRCSYQGSS